MLVSARNLVASFVCISLAACSARSGSHAEEAGRARPQATAAATPQPRWTAPPQFVFFLEGRPHLVVAQTVQPTWTRGKPTMVAGEVTWTAEKELVLEALPETLRTRSVQPVTLMGTRGALCTAELRSGDTALRAISRLVPDGPTAETAKDEGDRGLRLWQSETADHLVIRELVPLRGDCASALYAKRADDDRAWATASAPTGPQEEIARAAFRALPQYRAVKENDPPGASSTVLPTVRTFDVGSSRYYFVSEGEESSCQSQGLGALFHADRAETPRELDLVAVSPDLAGEAIGLVHDAVTSDVHVLYGDFEIPIRKGHEPDPRRTVRVPFEGCGC